MATPALQLENCSFAYGAEDVVHDLSLALQEREMLLVAGPNGAGKTTMLKLLSGLLTPKSGAVVLRGRPLSAFAPRERARELGVVLQDAAFHFPFTVGEIVRMGRSPYLGFWGFEAVQDEEAARRALAICDLEGLEHRYIHELSGGEKQRAILARALAQEPDILMLDEPTRALDFKHVHAFFDVLERIRREHALSLLIISHDLNALAPHADRMVLLHRGRVRASGTPGEMMQPGLLEEVFGVPVDVEEVRGHPMVLPRR